MARDDNPAAPRIRTEHAALTRTAILQGARKLFAEHGYATVTVKQLATQAGVSVQTIYDTFGAKRGVVLAIADLVDQEAGILDLVGQLREETDGRQMLALFARMRRQIRQRCPDIIHTLRSGAAADPDVAAAWTEGQRRRHLGQRRAMERLARSGQLAPGLDATRAADILAALTTDEICDTLVDQAGWSYDEYETWLSSTLARLILA